MVYCTDIIAFPHAGDKTMIAEDHTDERLAPAAWLSPPHICISVWPQGKPGTSQTLPIALQEAAQIY